MKYFSLLFLVCVPVFLLSNNIQINNVSLTGQNTTDDYYMIEFDLSWENSWRTSTMESNWDAAWVFVKFTPKNHHDWHHAALHYVDGFNDGHTAPPGAIVQTYINTPALTSEGVGVMIYRDSDGIGDVNWNNIQLRWDYGTDGIADDQVVEISVFAIEMVYVPQGAFYVGDGGSGYGQFEAGNTGQPFLIDSENAIILGGIGPSQLSNHDNILISNGGDDFDYLFLRNLPAAFPKGYDAFYCMKYEASQQQYADFLTHLTIGQRSSRDEDGEGNFGITTGSHFAITEYTWRAMGNMGWPDIATYLDWSGLRPMTELEYEKACRGPLEPIPDEYAWGNTSVMPTAFISLENAGTANEMISGATGFSVGYGNFTTTPYRCGIFAASAINKTRQETGSSYWGIMELTGNCRELALSVGNSATRDCQGLHGDGEISPNGEATSDLYSDWAPANGSGVGWRVYIVSKREFMAYNTSVRSQDYGIRGVRSAQ
ncbi:MAG: SUMF1/EgtB/PvdO family nonheme iron enzyme [Bacteroidota bacterium]